MLKGFIFNLSTPGNPRTGKFFAKQRLCCHLACTTRMSSSSVSRQAAATFPAGEGQGRVGCDFFSGRYGLLCQTETAQNVLSTKRDATYPFPSLPQRGRGTTKWWMRRARCEPTKFKELSLRLSSSKLYAKQRLCCHLACTIRMSSSSVSRQAAATFPAGEGQGRVGCDFFSGRYGLLCQTETAQNVLSTKRDATYPFPSLPQRGRGTTKWWMRRARCEPTKFKELSLRLSSSKLYAKQRLCCHLACTIRMSSSSVSRQAAATFPAGEGQGRVSLCCYASLRNSDSNALGYPHIQPETFG